MNKNKLIHYIFLRRKKITKRNCANCGNGQKDEQGVYCLRHGYSWRPYVAERTVCGDWK